MLCSLVLAAGVLSQSGNPIVLQVDATDAPRCMFRVVEDIPAKPGPFLLRYPKWIPGEHAPSGPLRNAVMMHVFANNKEIPWTRDATELYDLHVNVPDGANALRVEFIDAEANGDVATSNFARIKWNRMMFLPKGPVEQMPIRATLKVPAGWTAFDALDFSKIEDTVQMPDTNVERLIDSPALIGKYTASYTVAPGHELEVAGDEPKDVVANPQTLALMKNIVDEAHAVWGAQHYRTYKWLVTVSNFGGYEGLEHNECSEDGMGADGITGGLSGTYTPDLLCHEYTHSWNGKYRRPADLYQVDYATPQGGSLLWVYEGLTQYWGDLLPVRAGAWTEDRLKDIVTGYAAGYGIKDGRQWKSTEDTALAASIDRHPSPPWANATRGQDYYEEGVLLWIGVDAKIRQLTNGQKSLNDFCHIFAGAPDTGPMIKPYSYPQLVNLLDEVVPWDWDGYFKHMVYELHPAPTTEGIEMAGWKLVYNDTPGNESGHLYDLGIEIGTDGMISDMLIGSVADKAGISPGMKVLTVNDKPFSTDRLNEAITAAVKPGNPIVLEVAKDDAVSKIMVDYSGGLKYPHLERIDGTTDYLTQSCQPMVKHAGVK